MKTVRDYIDILSNLQEAIPPSNAFGVSPQTIVPGTSELVPPVNGVNAQGQNVTMPDGTNPESGDKTVAPAEPVSAAPAATTPKNRDSMTFSQAFADARKAKEQTFAWKGKSYNTQLATNQAQGQAGMAAKPQGAYRDPDQGGQGGQNALWLNQKFPNSQPGQQYWVKGTRYEKKDDGWYRSFEKSDWVYKPANKAASELGYTGPSDDKSVQAFVAKNRTPSTTRAPAKPSDPMQANIWTRDYGKTHNPDGSPKAAVTAESLTSTYNELNRIVSLVHHR